MAYLCEWQMDLFDQTIPTDYEDLRAYVLKLKESHEKVRKGMFSRLEDLHKKMGEQKDHIYFLQASVQDLHFLFQSLPSMDAIETDKDINKKEERLCEFPRDAMVNAKV